MITKNDKERQCVNGDVGVLRIIGGTKERPVYCVVLPDGRISVWNDYEGLQNMSLAYAITIHKAQGSEYERWLCRNAPPQPVLHGHLPRQTACGPLWKRQRGWSQLAEDAESQAVYVGGKDPHGAAASGIIQCPSWTFMQNEYAIERRNEL